MEKCPFKKKNNIWSFLEVDNSENFSAPPHRITLIPFVFSTPCAFTWKTWKFISLWHCRCLRKGGPILSRSIDTAYSPDCQQTVRSSPCKMSNKNLTCLFLKYLYRQWCAWNVMDRENRINELSSNCRLVFRTNEIRIFFSQLGYKYRVRLDTLALGDKRSKENLYHKFTFKGFY